MDAQVVTVGLINVLRRAIEPTVNSLGNARLLNTYLRELGWDSIITDAEQQGIASSSLRNNLATAQAFKAICDIGEQLDNNAGNETQLISNIITAIVNALKGLKNLGVALPLGSLPFPVNQTAFWNTAPLEILDRMVVETIDREAPILGTVLFMVGITDITNETPAGIGRIPYKKYSVQWGKLGDFLTNPLQLIKDTYRWGNTTIGFDYDRYLLTINKLFASLHFESRLEKPAQAVLDQYYSAGNLLKNHIRVLKVPLVFEIADDFSSFAELGIQTMPITPTGDTNGKPAGFFISPLVRGAIQGNANPTSTGMLLKFKGGFESDGLFRFEFRPDGVQLTSLSSGTSITAELSLEGRPASPYLLIGKAGSHRVELDGFRVAVMVKGAISSPEFIFEAGTGAGPNPPLLRLIFQPGEGDGFINKIFGTNPIEVDLGGMIRWSSQYGLGINGSVGFTIEIPLHLGLGPIEIQSLRISFIAGTNIDPRITAGVAAKLALGPLIATVDNIGARLTLKPVAENNKSGLLGNLDLDWGFNPPNGLGLSIDAQGFKGGGFLNFYPELGEYSGGLELIFQGTIALRAIGVLNTIMPDGTRGFSLLIIITAEFAPIQLGFGFTLIGVGGLLGLNRTMIVEQLQLGVKDGSLNSILFPTDIVANANRIVSDIKRIFPPQEGQFVFGPMAKIGWGTPTLLSIELGLLIELPDPVRIAILGVIRAVIPTEELAILRLQVNFLGVIDFEKGQMSFDAFLYDSRLLLYPLTGEMALRIVWKGEANFILSIGGFHPAYKPPPLGLGNMARLGISLLAKDNPRLTIECYFAVTSNTVQFGAKVELYAAAWKFNIYGMVAFDALFQFSPFYFIISLEGMIAVRIGTDVLFALHLKAQLEGTTPWHAKGSVTFSILFWDVSVGFDETWGDEQNTSLPPVDVKTKLFEALQNTGNWHAILPGSSNQLVTVKEVIPGANEIILHPFGSLRVTQKVVPLNITIQKLGSQKPSAETMFDIVKLEFGTSTIGTDKYDEQFAPAQFFELKNDEKLSRKSFEPHKGGITAKETGNIKANYFIKLEVIYELKYLRRIALGKTFIKIFDSIFVALLALNATAKSLLSKHSKAPSVLGMDSIKLETEKYVIANTSNLQAFQNELVFNTETEARTKMKELVARDGVLQETVQVIPTYQMN